MVPLNSQHSLLGILNAAPCDSPEVQITLTLSAPESSQLMANGSTHLPWSIPFRQDEELNPELQVIDDDRNTAPQLCRTGIGTSTTLPGNPFVDLELKSILTHLEDTLLTKKLDTIAPQLWVMSTQSSASITPLHKQRILGREITITDSADLHLIWYHSKIFVKPLPPYLLSYAFWRYLFDYRHREITINQYYSAALGFVRSYCYLIQSETDFSLAVTHGLIPKGIDFQAFASFINCFRNIPDVQASPRFHFGELRLTRLNFWSIFFLRQTHYFNMSRQYETYFSRFFQPLLFAFGAFSVLLSAMQVALAAGESVTESGTWRKFVSVSKWTSITAIFLVLFSLVWLLTVLIFKVLSELAYALRSMWRKRRNKNKHI